MAQSLMDTLFTAASQLDARRVIRLVEDGVKNLNTSAAGPAQVVALGLALLLCAVLGIYLNLPSPVPSIQPDGLMADKPAVLSSSPPRSASSKKTIPCRDPGTMELLGYAPAMTAQQVKECIARARAAHEEWRHSSFAQRRRVLSVLLKYILEHQEEICQISSKDSGKPMVDCAFGELIVTCEKIRWLMSDGERWLKPEARAAGRMMFYKKARVEYVPLGVVGAIVPFNYPFHNIYNPMVAALFAGNGIVIKVSEHASWSALYYAEGIKRALDAAGAPPDLVQIVTGYGDAGHALVTSGVDKVIFVGSTEVGKKVMASAADTLTPVVLELGGKDAFIVCEDADLKNVVPTALRGAFQACGQNCMGAERFIVHEKVVDRFLDLCMTSVTQMRMGAASGGDMIDFGSLCLPGLADKVQELVDDAVANGATVVVGGRTPSEDSELASGQFYPPTILTGVTDSMRIWHEEVFGPVMSVVSFSTDKEAIYLANDSDFGLGSSVFCGSKARARRIAAKLNTGMSSINDFASTYMSQSLPFGGVKYSGFDRFAGIEGLRGMCVPKSVAEDRWPFSTAIPPLLQYPVKDAAFDFVTSLVWMFYSESPIGQIKGLLGLAGCFVFGARARVEKGPESKKND
jgi:acyl-CoA reductase-like NAD-dependent aldehyde dehydrogenase